MILLGGGVNPAAGGGSGFLGGVELTAGGVIACDSGSINTKGKISK